MPAQLPTPKQIEKFRKVHGFPRQDDSDGVNFMALELCCSVVQIQEVMLPYWKNGATPGSTPKKQQVWVPRETGLAGQLQDALGPPSSMNAPLQNVTPQKRPFSSSQQQYLPSSSDESDSDPTPKKPVKPKPVTKAPAEPVQNNEDTIKLQQEVKELQDKLRDADKSTDYYKLRVQYLQDIVDGYQSDAPTDVVRKNLESMIQQLNQAVYVGLIANERLEDDLLASKNSLLSTQTELQSKKDTLKKFTDASKVLMQENKDLLQENEKLKLQQKASQPNTDPVRRRLFQSDTDDLSTFRKENQTLQTSITELSKHVANLGDALAPLSKLSDSPDSKATAKQLIRDTLAKQNELTEELEKQLKRYKDGFADLNTKYNNLIKEDTERKKVIKDLEVELEFLKMELEKVKKELAEYEVHQSE